MSTAEPGTLRGRDANAPTDMPPRGWRDIALRVKDGIVRDNISIVSAGVAFFTFLALFPALAASVSVYGLFMDSSSVQAQLASASSFLPLEARELILQHLAGLADSSDRALGVGALISLGVTLISANKGMRALLQGLSIAHQEDESRGILRLNLQALAFTVGAIVLVWVALVVVIAVPALLDLLRLGEFSELLLSVFRWPAAALLVLTALALAYRYGPDRDEPKWRWATPGALLATALWLLGSAGFSFYVSNFAGYGRTYGSAGAVAILMMWLYITTYVVLLGAEVNAQLEHQTKRDSTQGEPQPMGERDAYVADHVGRSP